MLVTAPVPPRFKVPAMERVLPSLTVNGPLTLNPKPGLTEAEPELAQLKVAFEPKLKDPVPDRV